MAVMEALMGLTKDDFGQIKEIVTGAIGASEARTRKDILTVADRLDQRIDETHVRLDAMRIESTREIAQLALGIQAQTNEIASWRADMNRRVAWLEQRKAG